ncbi:MAG: class I SAM-dependent methyltransferase [bacterium]|nr:methyltransferase domain-containing protein [Candidatus Margulisiibacteriota bacterium]
MKCRICGCEFFNEPLSSFNNMPAGAQNLPDKTSLKKDKGVNLKVCQCSGCGLVQLDSKPVSYYRDVIRAAAFSEEMKAFRLKQFADFVKKFSLKEKKVIEIGCGKGEYLSLMKECGVNVYGIEHLLESVKVCQKNDLDVSRGFVEKDSFEIAESPFDAFFILNFLEHLPNPNLTLRGIYNNLAEGAVGLVEVPNFDMMLRQKLFSEFIPDHLLYFTKKTLAFALELNGFEILECSNVWHDYIISAVVRRKKRLEIADFDQYQAKLKDQLEGFLNQFEIKQVAIWGAGHQSLAVLAIANLTDKIKYVVDSATFKQGKYTPATHLPILAPEVLKTDPVEAIIIMAASYSDEVVRIVRAEFDNKLKIAVLRDFGLEILKD